MTVQIVKIKIKTKTYLQRGWKSHNSKESLAAIKRPLFLLYTHFHPHPPRPFPPSFSLKLHVSKANSNFPSTHVSSLLGEYANELTPLQLAKKNTKDTKEKQGQLSTQGGVGFSQGSFSSGGFPSPSAPQPLGKIHWRQLYYGKQSSTLNF